MTFCVTNALSFELDDANEAEPIRLGAPSAAVSVAPLKLDVLWNEAIIPGPFNTPAAASAGTRKAVIASERFRHRPGDHAGDEDGWRGGCRPRGWLVNGTR